MLKPAEIYQLEKAYNLTLTEKPYPNSFNVLEINIDKNSYFLNKDGKIAGISIPENAISNLEPISVLKDLEYIDLRQNLIEDISPIYIQEKLRSLYLGGNVIKDISSLKKAKNLSILTLWENPIEDISPLSGLKNLEYLYCRETGIENLDFLTGLENLKEIALSSNKIIDVSPLKNLNNISYLDLDDNFIKVVSREVMEKLHWLRPKLGLEFSGMLHSSMFNNPLQFPPYSVVELGEQTMRNYYDTSAEFGYAPLSEGRIIVVGDGSAGKSSLIERILYNTFEQGKVQTNGIKIENWILKHIDDRLLTFHIWDFGGQEIQHAVHKFFFTAGCLYILVLDNRKEEEPEYWLQQIESLGGSAPVLVVFNKQDDNANEIADRKFLKEKYPNIVGFYNTSCKTGYGITDLKTELEYQANNLSTIDEQFPNNWFKIKKEIEKLTSGDQHYLDFNKYAEICIQNNAENETIQKLLLKYFTTIGAVTWFGDTYLNFLHVLSPAWITQGVYKILTSKKTATQFGVIDISDFKELLHPLNELDYVYDEGHYGYILSMMKKFDLCYTPDDKSLLIPSAFGKVPKLEYSEFRGEDVRTYILQFKDYMPLALIHRFTAKKLPYAFENNYWYSGIVIHDNKSNSLAMVHADKEAKRIYVRIKGNAVLGAWEHIRREIEEITSSYAKIPYDELVSLDSKAESVVNYDDLVSHLQVNKPYYFHPKLQRDFNVGYLIGLFETKENTIEKFKKGELSINDNRNEKLQKIPSFIVNILNNNSPTLNAQINIDIDIQLVVNLSDELKGEANYLLDSLNKSEENLIDALNKVVQFADDSKSANNSGDIKQKGWGRKLKGVIQTLSGAAKNIKNIDDGGVALKSIFNNIKDLATQFNLREVLETLKGIF